VKKGAKHDTWPPIPPKVARAMREGELLEREGRALPEACRECEHAEHHMRETVCELDGRCVSHGDPVPDRCPLRASAVGR